MGGWGVSTQGKGQELVLGLAGASRKALSLSAKFELGEGPLKESTKQSNEV